MLAWIIAALVLTAAALAVSPYRRRVAAALKLKRKTRNQAQQWGVPIHAPAREHTCPQVRDLRGQASPLPQKPHLPSVGLFFPHECQCRYARLLERGREDRPPGQARRLKGLRFDRDNPPRRSG